MHPESQNVMIHPPQITNVKLPRKQKGGVLKGGSSQPTMAFPEVPFPTPKLHSIKNKVKILLRSNYAGKN
jgi:hypothetical protein